MLSKKDIKKALVCCAYCSTCYACPLQEMNSENCFNILMKESLTYINQVERENEVLLEEVKYAGQVRPNY